MELTDDVRHGPKEGEEIQVLADEKRLDVGGHAGVEEVVLADRERAKNEKEVHEAQHHRVNQSPRPRNERNEERAGDGRGHREA